MAGKLNIVSFEKTVALAATPESILVDGKPARAAQIWLRAPSTNTSDTLMIGNSAGQTWLILKAAPFNLSEVLNRMGYCGEYELKDIYAKVGTNGDKVSILVVSLES